MSAATAPLAGIRVLDLTRLLPGPVATMHLAELGADVLKIEDPGAGDYARAMGPARAGASQFFVAVNRGKRLLRLDLKDPPQRAQLLELVDGADVLVESFRPGVMARLGLGWDELKRRKPSLVMCAISGYGQDGPFAQMAGHDINYLGYAGMLANNTGPDGVPVLPDLQVGDLLGGAQSALQGILAALLAVKMGGPGRFVDISMTDAVLAHNIMPVVAVNNGAAAAPARGLLSGGLPCYNIYRTADGRFMAVGALELKFWQRCCAVLQRPDLASRHWQLGQAVGGADALAVKAELDALFARRSMAQWTQAFGASDCCVTPILSAAEALRHPLFQARRMVARQRHRSEGVYWAIAHPIKFET
ncbi:CaiB/BaiF CoA transferase family protein [Janthinobacterium fluminis]|uniref:CaiB/BaiF CoA-transferase family protein n=1 Tax=Janthinobacterium fluminis TaxID=2987524 RepID=A0ABT5JUH2_9BURK|nr:CaiB/BaiF CoA-transferase family protein [Janthinobacterium fluminis]MDC8756141.1 CaiB/BaiF CoA-transferase family protein [Janthinobacterium fluminis]